jgi:hypothetical protein
MLLASPNMPTPLLHGLKTLSMVTTLLIILQMVLQPKTPIILLMAMP